MNIGIISPRVLLRKGLGALLSAPRDFEMVLEANEPVQALSLPEMARVEVLLVDAWDIVEGFEASAQVLSRFPELSILLLADRIDPELELRALKAGCQGCISRECDPGLLEKALRAVRHGEIWISHRASSQLLKKLVQRNDVEDMGELTRREWEILALVAAGRRNKEISTRLYVSENTVKTHLYAIYRKLHAGTRMEAALFFFQHANRQVGTPTAVPVAMPQTAIAPSKKHRRPARVAEPPSGA